MPSVIIGKNTYRYSFALLHINKLTDFFRIKIKFILKICLQVQLVEYYIWNDRGVGINTRCSWIGKVTLPNWSAITYSLIPLF